VNGGRAEWIDVQKGAEENGKIAVYGNLNAGDTIVKTATEELRNGAALRQLKKTE
ncbi:MAG: efflux RND transporter periplasmic adaptor subunit, partial [Bacteroidetes bacterium]|nr:efflux RND transporter periplasmic adaptor subunit [Bacteroidota bacterium]